jgi:formylmethanofuran dehydrogenase subunit D
VIAGVGAPGGLRPVSKARMDRARTSPRRDGTALPIPRGRGTCGRSPLHPYTAAHLSLAHFILPQPMTATLTAKGQITIPLVIHPDDAKKKGITDGDQVRLFSARGEVPLKARLSTEVKPGILYSTFHFPEVLVNIVTSIECDEDTMCPEYKVVAVDVEKVAPGQRVAVANTRPLEKTPEPVLA